MMWFTLQCRIELSENRSPSWFSETMKISIFLLAIVTNDSDVFRIELILIWAKTNLFKFLSRIFFKIFGGFNVGCLDHVDASFRLAEIFDSSELLNSTSITLYIGPRTKSFAT